MSSSSTKLAVQKILERIFKTKNLEDFVIFKEGQTIKDISGILIVEGIYGFNYGFLPEKKGIINFFRNDGKYGFITVDNLQFLNNILVPFLEYKEEDEIDCEEFIEEKQSDSAVRMHLLLEGDFYICHERIFSDDPTANKTKGLYKVVPSE